MVLLPISSDAWAWGDEGHKVICEIAMRLVHPTTRAEIQKLISTDERFNSFSDSCTWPDHPRQRAAEHFLNLPRDADGLHSETCPGLVRRVDLEKQTRLSGYLNDIVAILVLRETDIRVHRSRRRKGAPALQA